MFQNFTLSHVSQQADFEDGCVRHDICDQAADPFSIVDLLPNVPWANDGWDQGGSHRKHGSCGELGLEEFGLQSFFSTR